MSVPFRLMLVWLVAGAGLPPAAVHAQAGTGATLVHGEVVDATSGAPVSGASVRLEGPDTASVTTGRDGRWVLERLSPGRYQALVSRVGYVEGASTIQLPRESVRIVLEPRAMPLEALVVTASRRPQRLADVPVAVEVLGAEDLRRSGASDLASVLTERTGMQLQGGHPNGAGVMLQGLDSERVLILVDGQPWVGRISGVADLSRIPTSIVERVEVVKGPQAALYGSEAMGGVVNVITRRPGGEWNGSASVTSGSQGRLDTSVRVTGHGAGLGFGVDVGRRAENLIAGQGGGGAASVLRRDGRARVTWSDDGSWNVDATALVVDEDQRWTSGQLRSFGDNLQGALTLDGGWSRGAHTLGATLHGARFDHLLRRGTTDVPPPESTGDRQVQSLAELDLAWSWSDEGPVALDAGMEVGRERIEAETVSAEDGERTTVEPYTQATLRLGDLSIVPGLRFSHSTRWGGHWTPRLALMLRPLPSVALRTSVSSGYRAPSFKELGLDFLNTGPGFGYLVRGNPDLEPETSINLSAGVEWTGATAYGRVQGFHNQLDRFIETRALADSAGLTVYTYGNLADGRTSGVEVEAGWMPRFADMELGYALLSTEDARTGDALLGRPRHSGRLSLGIPVGAVRTRLSGVWTGATPVSRDPETGTASMRDAFLRFDARIAFRPMDRLDVALGLDNVLDAAPTAWPGFAGRRLHLTLTSTFLGTTQP